MEKKIKRTTYLDSNCNYIITYNKSKNYYWKKYTDKLIIKQI